MTDIVERLRKFFQSFTDEEGDPDIEASVIMNDAADEIECLRHDLERYMTIANVEVNESERLRLLNAELAAALEGRQGTIHLKAMRMEIKRLREALDMIGYDPPGYDECIDIARAALAKVKEGK